jgi:hypothetical protein
MKIVENCLIPFNGYLAINLFGVVFTRNKERFLLNPKNSRHEYTHTLQYKELWYIGFLPVYGWYWLRCLIKYRNFKLAYRMNPLEQEAYNTENVDWYNDHREKFAWRAYVKILKN